VNSCCSNAAFIANFFDRTLLQHVPLQMSPGIRRKGYAHMQRERAHIKMCVYPCFRFLVLRTNSSELELVSNRAQHRVQNALTSPTLSPVHLEGSRVPERGIVCFAPAPAEGLISTFRRSDVRASVVYLPPLCILRGRRSTLPTMVTIPRRMRNRMETPAMLSPRSRPHLRNLHSQARTLQRLPRTPNLHSRARTV
jgi:hypothetical protein